SGSGGLPYFVPFLMFLFLLALGGDYNILVMTRIREEAGRVPLRQAVRSALERTGSTVTSAGLVLAGTFGVFALVVGSQPGGGPLLRRPGHHAPGQAAAPFGQRGQVVVHPDDADSRPGRRLQPGHDRGEVVDGGRDVLDRALGELAEARPAAAVFRVVGAYV